MNDQIDTIGISGSEIRNTIEQLEAAIARSSRLKALYEELLATQEGATVAPRRRGRPKGSKNKTLSNGTRRTTRRRARGKTLRAAVVEVLAKSPKPLRPVQIRDEVIVSGYETQSSPQNLYTSVMAVLAKEPGVKKSVDGYVFDEGAAANGVAAKRPGRQKTSARKTPVRKARRARRTKAKN